MFVDVLRATPVEMRIELVDHGLVDRVREKADAEREDAAEENDDEADNARNRRVRHDVWRKCQVKKETGRTK